MTRFRIIAIPLAALMFLFSTLLVVPVSADGTKVKVEMGTFVELVFDSPVSGETATLGQTVNLKVSVPVVIDGKTVIAAGTPAVGEVTLAKKRGMVGSAGSLQVTAKQVAGVDGTVIALSGNKTVEGESHLSQSIVVIVLCCVL